MERRARIVLRLIALGVSLTLVGCDAVVTQSSPQASGLAGSPGTSGGPPSSETPAGTLGPPGPPIAAVHFPLPEPQLAEPFDIGQSLYDPALVPVAVVSLLDLMGIEILADSGEVVRPGADRGAGLLSLTEAEVRGFIEMTRADLDEASGENLPGPISVGDLHRALASSLPDGFTAEDLANGYQRAYDAAPDALAAQVMLGMLIEPSTRLLRIQMWLLLVDGFVRPGDVAAAGSAILAVSRPPGFGSSSLLTAPTGGLGAAAQVQPPLRSPIAGLSDSAWANLMARLPTLAFNVPFVLEGRSAVHEGHGGPGPRMDLTARILRPGAIVIRRTGQVVLPAADPGDGVPITWASYDEAVLNDHGRVDGQLGLPMMTDASGAVRISYQTKEEDARQRTIELNETGTLYGKVDQLALVIEAYDLPPEVYDVIACRCIITGTVNTSEYEFPIDWHEDDVLFVYIENRYNYTFSVGGVAELHRNGIDKASGNLAYNAADKTYRGTMQAISQGHAEGTAILTLGGIAKCGDDILGTQTLYVIGEKVGADQLRLRFYPESVPDGDFTLCQATIPYRGGGTYRRPFGSYLPLNDTRWSTPDPPTGTENPVPYGYLIDIPQEFTTLGVSDQSAIVPGLGICSMFYTSVTRLDPATSATPAPAPQPASWLCG